MLRNISPKNWEDQTMKWSCVKYSPRLPTMNTIHFIQNVLPGTEGSVCCKGMYKSSCVQSSMFEYTVVLVMLAPASAGTDM